MWKVRVSIFGTLTADVFKEANCLVYLLHASDPAPAPAPPAASRQRPPAAVCCFF